MGWFSYNPKDHFIRITFRNDTGGKVIFEDCSDDACDTFRSTEAIRVGHSVTFKIFRIRRIERWRVLDEATGGTVGCIPIRFTDSYDYGDAVVMPLSRAVLCPGHSFKDYQRVAR